MRSSGVWALSLRLTCSPGSFWRCGRANALVEALLGNYRAVPRAVVALPHCPEDGSGPRSTRRDIGEQKRDNPRRCPAFRAEVNRTKPPWPPSRSTASYPAAQQRYSTDLILRERALPDCPYLAAEHSTDSSEIASIDSAALAQTVQLRWTGRSWIHRRPDPGHAMAKQQQVLHPRPAAGEPWS